MSKQRKGRIHINNGLIEKFVKSEELDEYLKNGFVYGKLTGYKQNRTKKHWKIDPITNKQIWF